MIRLAVVDLMELAIVQQFESNVRKKEVGQNPFRFKTAVDSTTLLSSGNDERVRKKGRW
jgi:hypothetical protein